VLREAEAGDAETVLGLIDALADYEQLDRPDAKARERLFDDAFVRTPPRFWVYLIEDTQNAQDAVGYVIVLETYSSFLAKPTLYIEDLFVRPEARSLGAGSSTFRFLAEEALRRGCGRMEWVCLNWNELAISFYERRGAEHLSEWRYYRLTEENLQKLSENHT
jgi:GNAT superfamily N-acetyltransferase